MRSLGSVLREAVVIAIIIVIIGLITSYSWMLAFPEREDEGVPFWPMAGSLFITGVLAYLFREYTGLNRAARDGAQKAS